MPIARMGTYDRYGAPLVTRRVRGRLALSLVAVALVLAVGLPVAATSLARASGDVYVALGDSYAAGPGIPYQVETGCLRSDHNYPSLVADSIHPGVFRDATCSGATTLDMTQPQLGVAGIPEPPQFDALSADTTLVTVQIGGNDIGFAGIASTCAGLSLLNPLGAPCTDHFTEGGTDQLAAVIAGVGPRIADVLGAIHQRAPQARVLLVGYPELLPAAGPGCWPLVPLADGDTPYLSGVEVRLNQMLAAEAAAHGATYVDTFTPSIGHDMCQLLGPKWVEGFLPTLPAAPLHPNELGMQAMATEVLAALS